jgi:CCR4-NOT transcriptional regulation complex NOT5 subunit
MVCEECAHECTRSDFIVLRNLCDHLYLDSLAQKSSPSHAPVRGSLETSQNGIRKTGNHIMRGERRKAVLRTFDLGTRNILGLSN